MALVLSLIVYDRRKGTAERKKEVPARMVLRPNC